MYKNDKTILQLLNVATPQDVSLAWNYKLRAWFVREIQAWKSGNGVPGTLVDKPRTVKNYITKLVVDYFNHNAEFTRYYKPDVHTPVINMLLGYKIKIVSLGNEFDHWEWETYENFEDVVRLAIFACENHIVATVDFTFTFPEKRFGYFLVHKICGGTWPLVRVTGNLDKVLMAITHPRDVLVKGENRYWVQWDSPSCVLSEIEYSGWKEVKI